MDALRAGLAVAQILLNAGEQIDQMADLVGFKARECLLIDLIKGALAVGNDADSLLGDADIVAALVVLVAGAADVALIDQRLQRPGHASRTDVELIRELSLGERAVMLAQVQQQPALAAVQTGIAKQLLDVAMMLARTADHQVDGLVNEQIALGFRGHIETSFYKSKHVYG